MDTRGEWCRVDDAMDGKAKEVEVMRLSVGEIVEIHGEQFRVRKITRKDVVLRSVRSRSVSSPPKGNP